MSIMSIHQQMLLMALMPLPLKAERLLSGKEALAPCLAAPRLERPHCLMLRVLLQLRVPMTQKATR